MEQDRKRSGFTEGRKPYQAPEAEWVIVRNTHGPLVDEETFLAVQRIAEEVKSTHKERLGRYDSLGRQIKNLYESFALGDISKTEYLAAKAAAIQQRDSTAERLAELETKLENTGMDGELQNQFILRFHSHVEADIKEISREILSDLKEIHIYPGGQLENIWNYQEEYKNMMLDLEGEHQNGT